MFDEDLLKVYRDERQMLINSIRKKGIRNETVLDALNSIPRELFVSEAMRYRAYDDKALAIEHNQTISQPYTVAFMTQLLMLKPEDKVLEIGTGSGYQTAVLKYISSDVYSIEKVKPLFESSREFFNRYRIDVIQKCDDGSIGWIEFAPFDKIIVTAGAPSAPNNLIDQLSIGGRLVIPVGDKRTQTMTTIDKISNTNIEQKSFAKFKFVPLIGEDAWKK